MLIPITNSLCGAAKSPLLHHKAAFAAGRYVFADDDAGAKETTPMSITSKIVVSAFLLGVSLPAFAQGSAAPVTSPVLTHGQSVASKTAVPAAHHAMTHKVAVTEVHKMVPGTTIKTEAAKMPSGTTIRTEAAKSTPIAGIAKPVSSAPVSPVAKTN